MIDRKTLLADLQKLLKNVEADLLERSDSAEVPAVGAKLREEYAEARKAERTARTFEEWRADAITQTAAAWVLSAVFVRFLEDNELVDAPRISGPGDRLKRARDEHELYFRAHPTLTDRDYLLSVFDGLTSFTATKEVFGPHNPIRDLPNWLSGDAATLILGFFQKVDANTGTLAHDFTDPAWDTRFLGDLYQDLSEAARKKYALLQTPVFVEEFILDRTLDPAIEEFGLARPGYEERLEPDETRLRPDDRFRMIDPACGSGHFLLGSFARLVDRWKKREPGTRASVLAQRALDSVHGVDLNPFAIAIARFRLLLAALRACDVRRLKDAPGFVIHLACGDSLLHGSGKQIQGHLGDWDPLSHVYQPEDRDALQKLLRPGTYHAVVANPPYITPKDRALNEAYRDRYKTCHMKYSLAVPFLERIVNLAVDGGFTGQITANSFMKREFGKKLIEKFFPRVDLTHVIDTSGAYIPGHGTPTVILFIRNREPVASVLRTVMGIRGEPSTPDDPSRGLVWSAIVDQIDGTVGSEGTQPRAAVPQASSPSPSAVGQPPPAVSSSPQAKPEARRFVPETRRNLPHVQAEGKTYVITFCAKDRWVLPESVRTRVLEHCLHDDGVKIALHAAVVMPDHVHLLLTPSVDDDGNPYGLSEILGGIKGASAHSVNRMLGRKGAVWQDESFDHFLRSDESIEAQAEYIRQNPVRKGLVQRPEDYPWLWIETQSLSTPVARPPSAVSARRQPGAAVPHGLSPSEFVSVADSPRALFGKHPWSIGGGGAAELKEQLEESADRSLGNVADSIGITSFTLEDDIFLLPLEAARRKSIRLHDVREMIVGDAIRDWNKSICDFTIFLYDTSFKPIEDDRSLSSLRHLWIAKSNLQNNKMFGGRTKIECGLKWYEFGRLTSDKLRTPLSITFAFVATHNHFVLDRGGKVFKQSAPVIKLPPGATEEDHLALLGLLNSSTACFWMKQVFFPKGGDHVGQEGARVRRTWWDERYEFAGTGLGSFPIPAQRPTELAKALDELARDLPYRTPGKLLERWESRGIRPGTSIRTAFEVCEPEWNARRERMIALQEELDWECYRLYGLIDEDLTYGNWNVGQPPSAVSGPPQPRAAVPLGMERGNVGQPPSAVGPHSPAGPETAEGGCPTLPGIRFGERAFEIVMQSKMAAGELETTWFARHNATPIAEPRSEWPPDYQDLVRRRMEVIATNPNIALIEQPEYKRRWNAEPWESQLERALRSWLLDRLESYFDFDGRMNDGKFPTSSLPMALVSVGKLADVARRDEVFHEIGALYRDDEAFDVERLVAELVEAESAPLLPVLRYKPTGLRKRWEWERTWDLQRREDAIDARMKLPKDDPRHLSEIDAAALKKKEIGDVPVPPKYGSGDFLKTDFWRLRGKLDVPKERWTSFPRCEGEDGTLMVAWAGYDHLQLARAVSAHYVDVQERLGGRDDPRLVPLLACIVELLPWLKQWHNEVDPEFGVPMGDYFEGFLQEESRNLGLTLDRIRAWEPPAKPRGRRRASG